MQKHRKKLKELKKRRSEMNKIKEKNEYSNINTQIHVHKQVIAKLEGLA